MTKEGWRLEERGASATIAAGVFLVAFLSRAALRSHGLDQYDVAGFVYAVDNLVVIHPPGNPVLIFLARALNAITGSSVDSLIYISVLSGALFVTATYAIGTLLSGRLVGVIAALVLLLNPTVWLYSAIGMSDMPQAGFVALTVLCILAAVQPGRGKTAGRAYLYAASLLFGLTLGVKSVHVLLLPLLAYAFWWVPNKRASLLPSLGQGGAAVIAWWLPYRLLVTAERDPSPLQFLQEQLEANSLLGSFFYAYPSSLLVKGTDILAHSAYVRGLAEGLGTENLIFPILVGYAVLGALLALALAVSPRSVPPASPPSPRCPWPLTALAIAFGLSGLALLVLAPSRTSLAVVAGVAAAMGIPFRGTLRRVIGTSLATDRIAWLMALWVAPYAAFFYVSAGPQLRYYLPIYPVVALGIAIALVTLVRWLWGYNSVLGWLAMTAVIHVALLAAAFSFYLSLHVVIPFHITLDPRSQAVLWLKERAREGPTVVIVNSMSTPGNLDIENYFRAYGLRDSGNLRVVFNNSLHRNEFFGDPTSIDRGLESLLVLAAEMAKSGEEVYILDHDLLGRRGASFPLTAPPKFTGSFVLQPVADYQRREAIIDDPISSLQMYRYQPEETE